MSYIGQRPVVGRYIKLDQISSGFNGSNTGFSMTAGSQAVFPGTARNLLLSLGGVIQEPDTDFTISGSTLTFTTPPVANTTFFGVIYGDMQATGTPSDGTVLPASIASSGNFSFPQLTVTSSASLLGGVVFNENGADVDFRVEGDTNAHLLFADASADKIGINESSPSHKLVVGGDIGVGFTTPNDAARQINFNVNRGSAGQTLANINWQWNSKFVAQIRGIAGADTTNKDDAHLAFFTSAANNLVERFRILSDGKVGIGTTSPNTKLDVRDPSGTGLSSRSTATQATDTNKGLKVRNNSDTDTFSVSYKGQGYFAGNVGIGTTSPERQLHVLNSSGDALVRITSADGNAAYLELGDASDRDAGKIVYDNGDNLTFSTANSGSTTEKLRIQGNGNVGIGTTSPGAPLTIDTGGTADALRIGNSAGTDTFIRLGSTGTNTDTHGVIKYDKDDNYLSMVVSGESHGGGGILIANGGNVGIGTTSPSRKLEINSGIFDVVAKFVSSDSAATINLVDGLNADGVTIGSINGNMTFRSGLSTERMRIDTSGRLFLGLTTLSYPKKLNVQGESGAVLLLRNHDTTSYAANTNTSIEFALNTGNTGTQSGSCEIRAFKENGTNGNSARALSFYTGVNGGSPTERMRID